jgi:hypothetical protein
MLAELSGDPFEPSLAGVWIQAATALITAAAVVASIWIARSGQKHDLKLAKAEADRAERADASSQAASERAEAASRLSIDTLARMADALETLALDGSRRRAVHLPASRPPTKVAWSLRHHAGDTYLLENIGDASAFDVVLSADETLLQRGEWKRAGELKPGEAINFMAVRTMGTRDSTITVQWKNDDGDDLESWRYPLPPRPPRR